MGNMKVTYMNKASGHGDMSDRHTFVRCQKCKTKFVKELHKTCPEGCYSGKKGKGEEPEKEDPKG